MTEPALTPNGRCSSAILSSLQWHSWLLLTCHSLLEHSSLLSGVQNQLLTPLCLITGMTYERPAILKWLETRRHDPCTKAPLRKRHLAPNLALRGVIEAWVLEQCKKR